MRARALLATAALMAGAAPAAAQKDWYNLERERPFLVEDARTLEYRALEVSFGPLGWDSRDAGQVTAAAELAAGILPRTEVSLGLEGGWDAPAGGAAGFSGAELGILHALNVESSRLPAFAVRAGLHAPLGGLSDDAWVGELGAAISMTFGRVRVHTSGSAPLFHDGPSASEPTDWLGMAADWSLPLDATLLGAEVVRLGESGEREAEWAIGLGARRQLDPRTLAFAGVHLQTGDGSWRVGFGFSRARGF